MQTSRRVLAVDPGKMTGLSCWTIEPGGEPVLVWAAEVDEEAYATPIRFELSTHPDIEIVCESFTITLETAKKSQAPFSLELIGILKQIVRDAGRPVSDVNLQGPASAKKLFPNTALKKLNYWHRGGAGHALDSMRHGLLYLARTGWKPKGLLD